MPSYGRPFILGFMTPNLGRDLSRIRRVVLLLGAFAASAPRLVGAQEVPAAQWLRLDPLPGEMGLNPRESFDGVPPRFVLLTDGSVYVGGRRDVLKGRLDKAEMQTISTRLDLALKSLGKAGPPQTLVVGEGPAIFRFSVLLGSPLQLVVMGNLETPGAPALAALPDFIRSLSGFRHPSLRSWDPDRFTMIVKEKALAGGCRVAPPGLPPLAQTMANEVVVPEGVTRGFPTGASVSQFCDGPRRFTVVFRPLIPGER